VLQLSRQHQLLERENPALKDEEKKFRHELKNFREGLIMRKEVSSTDYGYFCRFAIFMLW